MRGYGSSSRRLIVLGYNATLTTAVEAPRQPKRHFDQIKALTRVNPRILRCLEVCGVMNGYFFLCDEMQPHLEAGVGCRVDVCVCAHPALSRGKAQALTICNRRLLSGLLDVLLRCCL